MNSYSRPLSIFLIVLPYMLLPAAVWLAANAPDPVPASEWSQGVRWSLRAIYFGGAFLGWRAGRPHWFYPWLGFAVYAAVAALLQFALRIMTWGDGYFLGIVLISLAFSPYFVAAIWLGWHRSQRLLAAYTVFPHAALTIPLFILVQGDISSGDWGGVLLSSLGAAAVAILFLSPSLTLRRRGKKWVQAALLFGGVLLAQSLFLIGMGYVQDLGSGLRTLAMLIPYGGLGWLILSGPLLLPPLLQWLIRLLRAEQATVSLWQKGRRILSSLSAVAGRPRVAKKVLKSVMDGDSSPKGEIPMSEETAAPVVPQSSQRVPTDLDRYYKLSIVVLAALAVIIVALYVGRAAVYKIHEFERGCTCAAAVSSPCRCPAGTPRSPSWTR